MEDENFEILTWRKLKTWHSNGKEPEEHWTSREFSFREQFLVFFRSSDYLLMVQHRRSTTPHNLLFHYFRYCDETVPATKLLISWQQFFGGSHYQLGFHTFPNNSTSLESMVSIASWIIWESFIVRNVMERRVIYTSTFNEIENEIKNHIDSGGRQEIVMMRKSFKHHSTEKRWTEHHASFLENPAEQVVRQKNSIDFEMGRLDMVWFVVDPLIG